MLEQEGSLVWLQDNDLGWIGGTVVSVGKSTSNSKGSGASELKVLDERGRVNLISCLDRTTVELMLTVRKA